MESPKQKQPSGKVLQFAVPQDAIEAQLEAWVVGLIKSNRELAAALERIRDSYTGMMAGESVTDAEQILAAVEAALTQAEKAKNVV
jgi:uncharacterized protein (DUF2342 family)